VLLAIGAWLDVNGEGIYGTRRDQVWRGPPRTPRRRSLVARRAKVLPAGQRQNREGRDHRRRVRGMGTAEDIRFTTRVTRFMRQ